MERHFNQQALELKDEENSQRPRERLAALHLQPLLVSWFLASLFFMVSVISAARVKTSVFEERLAGSKRAQARIEQLEEVDVDRCGCVWGRERIKMVWRAD